MIMYQVSRPPLSPKLTVQFDGSTKPCRITALISCIQMDSNMRSLLSLSSPTVSRISAQSRHHLRPRYPTRTSLVLYFVCSQIEWTISGLLLRVVENFNFNPGDRVRKSTGLPLTVLYKSKLDVFLMFSVVSWAKTLKCSQE